MFNNKKTLVSFVLFNLAMFATSINQFDSDRAQPDVLKFYETCNSEQENSIDIHDVNAIYNSHLKPFEFINFDKIINWSIRKNPQNAPVFLPNDKNISLDVSGSNFNETYNLMEFYFIWGESDNQGSKYMIDGAKFPLELRLVLATPSRVFSVIGFVFAIEKEDNPALKDILNIVSLYRSNSSNSNFEFNLSSILPNKPLDYYRYNGNSTCEGFTWSIMEQSISISSKQLNAFRETQTTKINRNVEKLNARQIFSSKKERRQSKIETKTNDINGYNSATLNSFSFSLFFISFSFKLFF